MYTIASYAHPFAVLINVIHPPDTVKLISISDEIYEMLSSIKRENESFSRVIEGLVKKSAIKMPSGKLSKETAETIISIRD